MGGKGAASAQKVEKMYLPEKTHHRESFVIMHVQVQLDRKTKNEKESRGWRRSNGGFNQNLSSFFKMHKLLLSTDQMQQNYTEKTT